MISIFVLNIKPFRKDVTQLFIWGIITLSFLSLPNNLSAYDGNGNMTKDALRNVVMTYDLNNQVKSVSRNDTLLSNYTYLADGTKYKVIDRNGNGRAYVGPFTLTIQTENTVKEYLENADAESGRIMEVRQQNGGSTVTSYTTLFLVKDHLGSVRAVTDNQGHVLERNSYYPFGLQTNQGESYPTITGSITTLYPNILSATQTKRDLYNGKEIQSIAGTDYLDYGFRQYDPVTARWMAVDPKAEKYRHTSAFNFCYNRPITLIDLNGCDWYSIISTDSTGKETVEYKFSYKYHSQEDLDKDNIKGTYIGISGFVEDNTKYLNLFGGEMQIVDSKSYRDALIISNLDNAIINYYRARYTNRMRPYPNQDFDVGLTDMTFYDIRNDNKKFEINKSEVYSILYARGRVFYTTANDLSNSYFSWGRGNYYINYGSFNPKYSLGSGIVAKVTRYYHRFDPVIWIFNNWESWNKAREMADGILLYRTKPF